MSVRLDRSIRLRLTAASRGRGRTPSALARAALEAWLDAQDGQAEASPYEALADLIGSVRGADRPRSQRGARAIAAEIRSRSDRRR